MRVAIISPLFVFYSMQPISTHHDYGVLAAYILIINPRDPDHAKQLLHLIPFTSRSANCNGHLGRKYMATVPQLDSIRGLYTLDIESLESYQIGNTSACLLWESVTYF